MKLSKFYGNIIESASGRLKGYVLAVCIEGEKIDGFCCCTAGGREFFADAEGFTEEDDKIKFLKKGELKEDALFLRLGRPVYSDGGKFLGYLADCTVKRGKLLTARVGKVSYPFRDLIVGDIIILKSPKRIADEMFLSALSAP